jgi:hypothetical protein
MMLWAEINNAVRAFGSRCLAPTGRYVVWHGEDSYGLRGALSQEGLITDLMGALSLPSNIVRAGFLDDPAIRSRRLQYGKFLASGINVIQAMQCADAGSPATMVVFEYGHPSQDDERPDGLSNTSIGVDMRLDDAANKSRRRTFHSDTLLLLISLCVFFYLAWHRRFDLTRSNL